MGASRRQRRRMQRRDITKIRKQVQRETDRRMAELIEQQEIVLQREFDDWDWWAEPEGPELVT